MKILRRLLRDLPTLLLATILAVAVWVSAVTAADPLQERTYPRTVPVEIIGQDPAMVVTSGELARVTLVLSAPRSVWDRLTTDENLVRCLVDLSALKSGTHTVPVQPKVGIQPARVISYSPQNLLITLETLITQEFPVRLIRRGGTAIGFDADTPVISQNSIMVSGPESLVKRVSEVRATLDLNQATSDINRVLLLQPIDSNGNQVEGLTLRPDRISVTQKVVQRGGYRTLVVKVTVTGQLPNGYRLSNIFAIPPTVTVFSSDPSLVANLPGYVETNPVNLTGAKDDLDTYVPLRLPPNISVVGESMVQVQVGIATIDGSVTLPNMPVEIIGASQDQIVKIAPERVDVIISGPLPILEKLTPREVRVVVDVSGLTAGKVQRTLVARPDIRELRVDSILPASVEVSIVQVTPTPPPLVTPSVTPTPAPAVSPTPRR